MLDDERIAFGLLSSTKTKKGSYNRKRQHTHYELMKQMLRKRIKYYDSERHEKNEGPGGRNEKTRRRRA